MDYEKKNVQEIFQQAAAVIIAATVTAGVVNGVSGWFASRDLGRDFLERAKVVNDRLKTLENGFVALQLNASNNATEKRRFEGLISDCRTTQKDVSFRLSAVEDELRDRLRLVEMHVSATKALHEFQNGSTKR